MKSGGVQNYQKIDRVLLKFCQEMLGLTPNASTIAINSETGTLLQWLRIYYRMIKYYVRIHIIAPLLVTEALTLWKNTPNMKTNWNASVCEITRNIPSVTMFITMEYICLGEVKKNLQEL